MIIPLSAGIQASVAQTVRACLKNMLLCDAEPAGALKPLPPGRIGNARVLPPFLSEMGMEIRHHIARVEPWIRNGWKVVTKRPAFYPPDSTIDAPEFFEKTEEIMLKYGIHHSRGGYTVPPSSVNVAVTKIALDDGQVELHLKQEHSKKAMTEALAEIELRQLFLEWFYADGRYVSEYDRAVLSFSTTSNGNFEYALCAPLRPGFLPPTFVQPLEPIPPHIGVQIRQMRNHVCVDSITRNSTADWMIETAQQIAAYLKLPLLVYGHPDGCFLPEGFQTSWDPTRPDGLMARELGYLKSCQLMLAPDSGWADLMVWLEIPTLLERLKRPGEFSPMAATFRPRMRLVDRNRPVGPQADELLAMTGIVLPNDEPPPYHIDSRLFPWEP